MRRRTAPWSVDPKYISTLVDMMTSVISYGTGKRATLDRPVAGKTGTTNDSRDAWFVGFTADYTTGVWMGNDNNRPMQKVSGGGFPAQLWHDYMVEAESGLPVRALLSNLPTGQAVETPSASPEPQPQDDLGSFIHNLLGGGSSSGQQQKPPPQPKPDHGTGHGVLGTLPADR